MSSDHDKYRYSITCKTDDAAVLFCLRSLCQYTEEYVKKQIGWGGTKTSEWKSSGGAFTLRFTRPEYRDRFVMEAQRLLNGRWSIVSTNNNDPATPQRETRLY
jgi:hypothetical protein